MSKSRRGRGEGSIFQSGDRWCCQVTIGKTPSGNAKRKTVSGETKAKCQEELRKLLNKMADGTLVSCDKTTCEGFFNTWVETTIKGSKADSTYEFYQRNIKKWVNPIIGQLKLSRLTKSNIQTVLQNMQEQKRKLSPRTRQIVRGILKQALKSAVEDGLISKNPCDRVARPQSRTPEFQVYDDKQTKLFLNACEHERLGPLWATAVLTGMRVGELLALQPQDVDLAAGRIHVRRTQSVVGKRVIIKTPKTAAGKRAIVLTVQNIATLLRFQATKLAEGNVKSQWFFCDEAGEMLLRSAQPLSSFDRIIKAAIVPRIRPHDLRHTHATLLLMAGENAKVVQERLGHSSIKITLDLYGHVLPSMQQGAAVRLDKLLG